MDYKQVWWITGASTGFGLHLMNGLLQNGQRVAAVLQERESLQDLIQGLSVGNAQEDARGVQKAAGVFQETTEEIFLPLTADFTNEDSVRDAVQQTIRQFGKIDVVVNYAGYDLPAPIDTLTECQIQQYFEENVFSTYYALKHIVPYLREQGSGMILNFSSEAVVAAAARSTLYKATKLAIESLTGELTEGVEALGIQQTFIGPGSVLQPQRPQHDHHEKAFKNNCMGASEKWALHQRVSRAAWA